MKVGILRCRALYSACEHYDACLCEKASSVSGPSLRDGPLRQLVMKLHNNRCLIRALRVTIATVPEPAMYKLRSARSSPIGKHRASLSHAESISTASLKNASGKGSQQVCTAGSHCRSACKTGSQPGHGVVKHSWGHHQDLNLCTRCSEGLGLQKNASGKGSEQGCTAGRHCRSACKTGSQPGHGVVKHSWGHHTRLILCTSSSLSLWLYSNASCIRSQVFYSDVQVLFPFIQI